MSETPEYDDFCIKQGESWESYSKSYLRRQVWRDVEDLVPYAIVAGAFIWAMVWMFRG